MALLDSLVSVVVVRSVGAEKISLVRFRAVDAHVGVPQEIHGWPSAGL